jgi:hypothetical protein
VRRLEGVELFPRRDLRGVHWFDEAEVRDVKRRIARGAVDAARGAWLDRSQQRWSRGQQQARPAAAGANAMTTIVELERDNAALRLYARELEEKLSMLCDALDGFTE